MTSQKSAGEIYCRSCGDTIKERAEICPHCGVRNEESSGVTSGTGGSTTGNHGSSGIDLDEIAPYIAWAGGLLLLLMALGVVAEPSGQFLRAFMAGTVLCATGLFSLPPVRERLAARNDIRLERGIVVIIVLVGLFTGGVLGPS